MITGYHVYKCAWQSYIEVLQCSHHERSSERPFESGTVAKQKEMSTFLKICTCKEGTQVNQITRHRTMTHTTIFKLKRRYKHNRGIKIYKPITSCRVCTNQDLTDKGFCTVTGCIYANIKTHHSSVTRPGRSNTYMGKSDYSIKMPKSVCCCQVYYTFTCCPNI